MENKEFKSELPDISIDGLDLPVSNGEKLSDRIIEVIKEKENRIHDLDTDCLDEEHLLGQLYSITNNKSHMDSIGEEGRSYLMKERILQEKITNRYYSDIDTLRNEIDKLKILLPRIEKIEKLRNKIESSEK